MGVLSQGSRQQLHVEIVEILMKSQLIHILESLSAECPICSGPTDVVGVHLVLILLNREAQNRVSRDDILFFVTPHAT